MRLIRGGEPHLRDRTRWRHYAARFDSGVVPASRERYRRRQQHQTVRHSLAPFAEVLFHRYQPGLRVKRELLRERRT